jgi:hypothetical protein
VQKSSPSIFFSEPLPELKECLAALEDIVKVRKYEASPSEHDVVVNRREQYVKRTDEEKSITKV